MRKAGIVILCLVALGRVSVYAQRDSAVDTVQLRSQLIGAVLPYKVILPREYNSPPARARRYPVLYLLHGVNGHYTDWITRTNVADYAAQYRMIIVTPEDNNGWYTDSVDVPLDKYESYILQELIPDVDKRYRTIQARYGRALAGLSMGGYGAFKLAIKYPSQFAFAGSMSGAFGVTRYTEQETGAGAAWETFLKLFGPPGGPTRKTNDLFELVRNLPAARITLLPYFYFDCGTEDSPQIFDPNRELADLFVQKRIVHEYRELPGNHSWSYWDAQVKEVLQIAAQNLRLPPVHTSVRSNRVKGASKGPRQEVMFLKLTKVP